jgi:mono/diheme cytochrome c family protein
MRSTPARLILMVGAASAVAMLGSRLLPPGRVREPASPIARPRASSWMGIWALVIVLAVLAAAFASWQQQRTERVRYEADQATGGVAARAIPIMTANGCAGCHTISGVPGAQGLVGPRLDSSLASRVTIGGVASNTPENLIRWIRAARQVNPNTAMPSTGISEQEARDVAAYLYALK